MRILVSNKSFYSPYSIFSPTESTKFLNTDVGSIYFEDVSAILANIYFKEFKRLYSF